MTGAKEKMWPREELLREAITLTTGDRNNQYGPPTQDFKRTAALLTAFGFRFVPYEGAEPRPIKSHQIAIVAELLKISRKAWMPHKRDSWADTAGYAGCGWECVVEEIAEEEQAKAPTVRAGLIATGE
jgi:hypothetical protein